MSVSGDAEKSRRGDWFAYLELALQLVELGLELGIEAGHD
jgi:hypothetical protein